MSSVVADSHANDVGLSADEEDTLLSTELASTSQRRRIGFRSYVALVSLLAVVLLADYAVTKKNTKEPAKEHETSNSFLSLEAVAPVSNPAYKGPALLPGHCVLLSKSFAGDEILEAAYAADFAVYDYIYIGSNKDSTSLNWRRIEGLNPLRLDNPLTKDFPPGTRCDKVILPQMTVVFSTTVAPLTSIAGGVPCAQVGSTVAVTGAVTTTQAPQVLRQRPMPNWFRWGCSDYKNGIKTCPVGMPLIPDNLIMKFTNPLCNARTAGMKGSNDCCCEAPSTVLQDLQYAPLPGSPTTGRQDQFVVNKDLSKLTPKYFVGQKIAIEDFSNGEDPHRRLDDQRRLGAPLDFQAATITSITKGAAPHVDPTTNLVTPQQYIITFAPPLARACGKFGVLVAVHRVKNSDVTAAMVPDKTTSCDANQPKPCMTCLTEPVVTGSSLLTIMSDLGFVAGKQVTIGGALGEVEAIASDVNHKMTLTAPLHESDGHPAKAVVTCKDTCAEVWCSSDPAYLGLNTLRSSANVLSLDESATKAFCCFKKP